MTVSASSILRWLMQNRREDGVDVITGREYEGEVGRTRKGYGRKSEGRRSSTSLIEERAHATFEITIGRGYGSLICNGCTRVYSIDLARGTISYYMLYNDRVTADAYLFFFKLLSSGREQTERKLHEGNRAFSSLHLIQLCC